MEPLVDGHPGEHETWGELAECSLLHDDLFPVPHDDQPAPALTTAA